MHVASVYKRNNSLTRLLVLVHTLSVVRLPFVTHTASSRNVCRDWSGIAVHPLNDSVCICTCNTITTSVSTVAHHSGVTSHTHTGTRNRTRTSWSSYSTHSTSSTAGRRMRVEPNSFFSKALQLQDVSTALYYRKAFAFL
jgi:hypothetical protein